MRKEAFAAAAAAAAAHVICAMQQHTFCMQKQCGSSSSMCISLNAMLHTSLTLAVLPASLSDSSLSVPLKPRLCCTLAERRRLKHASCIVVLVRTVSLACYAQVVPSGSLAVFTEDDTAAAAAAAKPDPMEQMQATITELQQQIQAMAKTQEAMAKCVLGKQSDAHEPNEASPSQSQSEATSDSPTVPKSEATEGSSKSWLPSMPSILSRT